MSIFGIVLAAIIVTVFAVWLGLAVNPVWFFLLVLVLLWLLAAPRVRRW